MNHEEIIRHLKTLNLLEPSVGFLARSKAELAAARSVRVFSLPRFALPAFVLSSFAVLVKFRFEQLVNGN